MSATNPIGKVRIWGGAEHHFRPVIALVLFQVGVICPHNDLMFSGVAYSDVLPFGAPGVWQNQGLSCSLILPASRVVFLGACLLSTFSFRGNEDRPCFAVFSLYIRACKQKTFSYP